MGSMKGRTPRVKERGSSCTGSQRYCARWTPAGEYQSSGRKNGQRHHDKPPRGDGGDAVAGTVRTDVVDANAAGRIGVGADKIEVQSHARVRADGAEVDGGRGSVPGDSGANQYGAVFLHVEEGSGKGDRWAQWGYHWSQIG